MSSALFDWHSNQNRGPTHFFLKFLGRRGAPIIINYLFSEPSALVQPKTESFSFDFICPGICVVVIVLFDAMQYKNANSSGLKTFFCSCAVTFSRSTGRSRKKASSSQSPSSLWDLNVLGPEHFLNFHSQLSKNLSDASCGYVLEILTGQRQKAFFFIIARWY